MQIYTDFSGWKVPRYSKLHDSNHFCFLTLFSENKSKWIQLQTYKNAV